MSTITPQTNPEMFDRDGDYCGHLACVRCSKPFATADALDAHERDCGASGMNVILTHKGEDVRLTTTGASNESGCSFRVTWCSNWAVIDELVETGTLRRVNYGPATFGHCEYFYV